MNSWKTIHTICVFCGSSEGNRASYARAARDLGHALADNGLALVYGGAKVGLMGIVADAVLERGGSATGVIPTFLASKELAHPGLTKSHVVATMHERKALMARLSDAFIALPGGFGTFEELMEMVTWNQLGVHRKPCGVLNVDGYFDLLLALVDRAANEKFLDPDHRTMLLCADDPESLFVKLDTYEPPHVKRWLRQSET